MEKNIEIGLLYEFYNSLLTQKQQYVIDAYYNNDLSLSEIAEEIGISRQGVQKQIKDAEKVLYNYEDKLQLLQKFLENKTLINEIVECLDSLKTDKCNVEKDIENIKQKLKQINIGG